MKVTAKRNRSDSASAAVRAVQAVALGPHAPLAHADLREGDRPFWDAIMLSRARETWTDVDLATAANMARTQADVERLQKQLDIQGYIIYGRLGPGANPLVAIIETLSRRAVALARVIHVHAEATVGNSRDAEKALKSEKQARSKSEKLSDTLIPTLRMVV